jgi:hypothetical protein
LRADREELAFSANFVFVWERWLVSWNYL